jgi:hypothetical protein
VQTLDSSDIQLLQEGDDEQFSQRLLALSEPYHVIAQILKEYHQKHNAAGSVGLNDFKLMSDLLKDSGLTEAQIMQGILNFQEEMNLLLGDKEKEKQQVYDAFCQLFNRDFFQELIKALLKEYGAGADIPYTSLFSGANRTLATENKSCNCDKTMKADERGCELCDPIEVVLSSELIRLNRNKAEHLHNKQRQITDLQTIKLQIFFASRRKISLDRGIELKLYATFFHFLGCNDLLWEKPPDSIADLWRNYPFSNSNERLKSTIQKLLQNNHGWAKEGNYVDDQDRIVSLERALNLVPVITIYGEGGLGKTELVYQTLSRMLEKSSIDFDELIPYTFKTNRLVGQDGSKTIGQGEFDPRQKDSQTGQRESANQIGWQTAPNIQSLIVVLAKKHEDNNSSLDLTTPSFLLEAAVDYLIQNSVWLIIDNHETKDDGQLEAFLKKYAEKRNTTYAKGTRIIVTSRVKPKEIIGTLLEIPVLNGREMRILAEKRVRWDRKIFSHKKVNDAFSNAEMFQTHVWEEINRRIRDSLDSDRYRKIAGHPYVVFTAVHRALFSEEHASIQFNDIVLKLIKQWDKYEKDHQDGIMLDLQDYMFSHSFMSLINEENAERYFKLTQYSELTTRIFRDKVAFENWEEIIDELRRRDIIILRPNNDEDEIFEWRTGRHPKLLQDHLAEEYKVKHQPKKESEWNWWKGRMGVIGSKSMPPQTYKATLATMGIGTEDEEKKADFQKYLNALSFKWLDEPDVDCSWDFEKLIQVLIHFSDHYLDIISDGLERERFPFEDNSEILKTDYLNTIESIINTCLKGVNNYLRYIRKSKLKPTYETFTIVVDILTRSRERRKQTERVWETGNLRDIGDFLQRFDKSWGDIYCELVKNLPKYTKSTSTQHERLLELGSFDDFGPTYLFTVLPKFDTGGPNQDKRLQKLLVDYTPEFYENREDNQMDIKLSQDDLQPLSEFLYSKAGMIDENDDGNLSKLFLIALYNYVGDDNSGRDVLFKRKENISFISESSGRTLVGFDEEEKTSWKIYNYTNVNQPDNFYVVNCIPFYVDDEGTVHAFFLQPGDKDAKPHGYNEPKSGDSEDQRPPIKQIVEIPPISDDPEQIGMREILKSIQFHSIPAALLFGSKLKTQLEKEGIESKGKVWRTWRNKWFPPENIPEGVEPIVHIIEELSEGEWDVLELDAGNNKTIRKKPQDIVCKNCNSSTQVKANWRKHDGDGGGHDWSCLSCDHDIDVEGNCLISRYTTWKGECKACLGYPVCAECGDREDVTEVVPGELYNCAYCEFRIDKSGDRHYDYDVDLYEELRDEKIKREEKLMDLSDELESFYDQQDDKDYQKRGKGKW